MKLLSGGWRGKVARMAETGTARLLVASNRGPLSVKELAEKKMGGATLARADLHISRTRDGELLLTSRQDGMIRMLVPDSDPRSSRN